ncbi:TonB-dependent receptor plug domain-containing protein [Flagellimonas hymeniacidonis]|uniref:TonB-dependent receptor plug domain-containing protein n=1 Tax=Flagellimonas hymeniacidonis TaxID=2603628 RepID=A0A5C8V550_9FLAO|nr:vWA domain-containing protein [Flagellimonas hymeniacidonis]TXN35888.1 TonB-dependent receptor plug domain-containing protein [Flagellimonas hymeniacidonis]
MKNLKLLCFLLVICLHYTGYTQERKNVTICWDVSLSMMDRDIEKEYYFLDAYFKTVQNANVTLLTFSNEVISKDNFNLTGGKWTSIKEKLNGLSYDGATSYSALEDYAEKGDVLLFTDGQQNSGTSTPNFEGELYIINSNKVFDRATLNLLAIVNNGNLVDLKKNGGPKSSQNNTKQYSGTIYNGTSGLAGAMISIKGVADKTVRSNEQGLFKINAAVGDTLVISYGNKKKEQLLGDNLSLNFSFEEGGIRLQEVVVTEKAIAPVNEITTGYGKENEDKVGYAVQSIDDSDISAVSTTANNAVQGKFSGVSLGQNDDLSQVKMRPSNSILGNNYGLIVIDGVPTERSNSGTGEVAGTGFVDPQNIANITVLKGLAATNRYGSMGANGVLLITTKTATVDGPRGKKKDLALLTNNVYDGKLKVNNKTLVTPYLKELKKGKNLQEAYDIYLKQRETYWNDPTYLLDVYSFFQNSNKQIANRILSNVLEKPSVPYEELRGMYLKSLEHGSTELMVLSANKMIEAYPNKVQPYFDMAVANKNQGNYQEALDIFTAIANGTANPKLNFSGLEKVVGAEIRNLVNKQKNTLDIKKVEQKYKNNLTYNARLLLDWNNPDAEFIVQFVNPQKRFFSWEHTDTSERKKILDQLQHGYSNEQFEIVGPETLGDWILNVTYLGNRTSGNKMPTFLKCTVQYNFGKPDQRSEEHLVRLGEVDEELQLAKFTVQ